MYKTWASGPIELLNHAEEHIGKKTAFDKRIAFISIDNCVELLISTYLSLPKQFFPGERPSRNELEGVFNNFTGLLNLFMKYASSRIGGIDPGDIEHYHRIRNKLYHDGTGLSVDDEYINAYFVIAKIILKELFGVEYDDIRKKKANEISIENMIVIWNKIEALVKEIYAKYDIDSAYTYKWEEMMRKDIISLDEIQDLTEVRMSRNRIVHSEKVDYEYLKESLSKAIRLKGKLEKILARS